jgi:hypothetical protein
MVCCWGVVFPCFCGSVSGAFGCVVGVRLCSCVVFVASRSLVVCGFGLGALASLVGVIKRVSVGVLPT